MPPTIVKCPTCERPLEWSPQAPFRPFCSDRCRLIDLGAWLSEERAIPGETQPGENIPQSPTEDNDG